MGHSTGDHATTRIIITKKRNRNWDGSILFLLIEGPQKLAQGVKNKAVCCLVSGFNYGREKLSRYGWMGWTYSFSFIFFILIITKRRIPFLSCLSTQILFFFFFNLLSSVYNFYTSYDITLGTQVASPEYIEGDYKIDAWNNNNFFYSIKNIYFYHFFFL